MIDLPLEHIIGERNPETGKVVRDVRVCAMTGSRDVGVTQGIPGTPYFYRLTGSAARRMTDVDRDAIKTAALTLAPKQAPKRSQRDAPTGQTPARAKAEAKDD